MGSKMIWSRKGTFTITDDLIDDAGIPVLCALFEDAIIINAEHDLLRQEIKYWALSEKFDTIPTGHKAPEYRAIIHQEREEGEVYTYSIEWKRVPIIPSDIDVIITILDEEVFSAEQKVTLIEQRLRLTRQIRAALDAAKTSPRANPNTTQDAERKNDSDYAGPGNASLSVNGQDGVGPTKTGGG
jgi:hypothetical protein